MFAKTISYLTLVCYTALTGILLVSLDANVISTLFFLTVLPTMYFWFNQKIQHKLVIIVLALSLFFVTVLEVLAYINGLWYEVTPLSIRVFGLFPLEAYLAGFVHMLYFVTLYEYFFDDSRSNKTKLSKINTYVTSTFMVVASLVFAYIYLFSSLILSYTYSLLLVLGSVLFLLLVNLTHTTWQLVLKKCLVFVLALVPINLIYEWVLLSNELRFFANFNEYIGVFSFFGQTIPYEEMIFVVLSPLWFIVFYEMLLDDKR